MINKISKRQNIIFQYLIWQFFDMPKEILRAWNNFLRFGLNYFSISLLFKTFFAPWHKYIWYYPRGFDFGKYFEVFISNSMSRIIGAIIRVFLIIFGLITEIFIFFAGLIVFLGWLFLPIILITGLFFSFGLIF